MSDNLPAGNQANDVVRLLIDMSSRLGAIEEHVKAARNDRVLIHQHISAEESEFAAVKDNVADVRVALAEIRTRLNEMPDDTHRKHHEFIDVQVAREKQRSQIRQGIVEKLATGGAWAVVVGFFTLLAYAITHWIEEITTKGS